MRAIAENELCRSCHRPLDGHTHAGEGKAVPAFGDLSICFYCGTVSKFGEDLSLIPLSSQELLELNDNNPEAFDLLMTVRKHIGELNG